MSSCGEVELVEYNKQECQKYENLREGLLVKLHLLTIDNKIENEL